MSGRGSTGVGRPAPIPAGSYQPPQAVHGQPGSLVVEFVGEDGRHKSYALDRLPLPGWHASLAEAWHARVGPTGSLRTLASANGAWAVVVRLLRFLETTLRPPADPSQLTEAHLAAFHRHRQATIGVYVWRELRDLGVLFRAAPLRELMPASALDYLRRRVVKSAPAPKPGYSDYEFRQIVAAARGDVARVRNRIAVAEAVLDRYAQEAHTLADDERQHATILAGMADTGVVPIPLGGATQMLDKRRQIAEQLFVTRRDLVPVLVLLIVVTGHNIETVKELPVDHRVIEGRAVELVVTKRRRGPRRWRQTVTWEIGPPGRELHTPGGLYLLLHRLMRRSRDLLGPSPAFWAVWHNQHRTCATDVHEHYNPFGKLLNANIYPSKWVARHGLIADQPAALDRGPAPRPLGMDFNRLKTSVEVRRTKQTGGHLPSAVRTNTIPVLFRNYLRGDPTTVDWAQQVVAEAFSEVEQAAWSAHKRELDAAGGQATLRVAEGDVTADNLVAAGLDRDTARQVAVGNLDTAWSACTNHDQHPATEKPCRASFLDCFHCGNCLITQDHLPRLLGLLDALATRRQQLAEDDWWNRYGPTWMAIRHDVLAKFSPAEIAQAAAAKPSDTLLDLVEPAWEQP